MAIQEVYRSEDGHGGGRNPYEPFPRHHGQGEQPPCRREIHDSAQVTSPNRAALRLLRERIIQNTRLAFQVHYMPAHPYQLPPVDPRDIEGWVGSLWQDLVAISGPARLRLGDDQTHLLLEEAFGRGTRETLEILGDMGADQDEGVWNQILGAIEALRGRVLA